MNRIKRLTRPFVSVIKFCTAYLGGRSYDFRGDSRTPFSDSIEYNDSLHYSNRHGLHLNPTKKRRSETLDNTKEMNDL
jgi:hypothetical protein